MRIINLIKLMPKIAVFKTLYYSIKFNGIVVVGRNCKINIKKGGKIIFENKKSSVYIGVHFSLAQGATLDIYQDGILQVGKSVGIYRGSKIVVQKKACLSIGSGAFINENSRVQCLEKITIGNLTSIAWNCTITDSDLHGIYQNNKLLNPNSQIFIGDNVWVGANTTITKGVVIKSNCIIGANSLVTNKNKALESNCIYGGNPLKYIKKFDYWGSL